MKLKLEQAEVIKAEKQNQEQNNQENKEDLLGSNKKGGISISFANKNPRGRPTRVKNLTQDKICKTEIAHNKLKANENNIKNNQINTLDFFMNSETAPSSKLQLQLNETSSNINAETFNLLENSKLESENKELDSNDINIAVFKSNIIHANPKYSLGGSKKKVTLKDYMFYLEKNRTLNIHQTILHKILAKINN